MLIVHSPRVEAVSDQIVRLKATFEDGNLARDLWYSTTSEFSEYFCPNRSDPFVLPVLIYAMQKHQMVRFEAPISERLYYSVTNYLEKAFVHIFSGWREVRLESEVTSVPIENIGAVGTGLSCGIDSFSTIVDHFSTRVPKGHILTHVTFFNVGGHSPLWDDINRTQELFKKRTLRVQSCARELGLPLVTVDSNLEQLLGGPFAPTHTFRSVSAVLALQKLFKTYYYSSGHSAFDFAFNPKDSSDYDVFSLPMISTESLNVFSSGTFYTRITKTAMVSLFPLSYRFLNVCLFDEANCSRCEKCLRTLLTLDILGKLKLFENVFDVDVYETNKPWFIGQVLAQRRINPHYRELYEAMMTNNFDIGCKARAYGAWYAYRVKNKIKQVLSRV